MFHWDRLLGCPRVSNSSIHSKKKKKKKNAFSLNCREFRSNEDYPKIGEELLSDFENIKTTTTFNVYLFLLNRIVA